MKKDLKEELTKHLMTINASSEEELQEAANDFIQNVVSGNVDGLNDSDLKEVMNTPEFKACELLDKIEDASSEKEAYKYAKKAHELCPEFLDATMVLATLEPSFEKKHKLFEEGLELEEKRLKEIGFFDKKYVGKFSELPDTNSYLQGLFSFATTCAIESKVKKSRDLCKKILELDYSDFFNVRYLLMATCAYLEDEEELLKLERKYKEESTGFLVPLIVLYYKKNDFEKAREYLDRLKKSDSKFIKKYKHSLEEMECDCEDDFPDDVCDALESLVDSVIFDFLLPSVYGIEELILSK